MIWLLLIWLVPAALVLTALLGLMEIVPPGSADDWFDLAMSCLVALSWPAFAIVLIYVLLAQVLRDLADVW